MAEWWIDYDNGNDANGNGTRWAPRRSFPNSANLAHGDTIYRKGTLRPTGSMSGSAMEYINAKHRISLLKWPGEDPPVIRGDFVVSTSWTNDTGNRWVTTVGTIGTRITATGGGVVDAGVTWNYDASVNANGHHYGHLKLVASAAAVTSTPWSWFYSAGTLYINLNGADPTTGEVTMCVTQGRDLVYFNACEDPVIRDTVLKVATTYVGGYGIRMNGCTRGLVSDIDAEDVGTHGIVWYDCIGSNTTIRLNGSGMTRNGAWITHFSSNNNVVAACSVQDCEWTPRPWLDPAGAGLEGLSGQQGGYAHNSTSDTDKVVGPITYTGCVFTAVDGYIAVRTAGAVPLDINNAEAVDEADAWDYTQYPMRAIDCRIVNWGILASGGGGYVAYHRCRFDHDGAQIAASTDGLVRYTGANPARLLFSSCEINIDMDTGTVGDYVSYASARYNQDTHHFYWLNCTLWNPGVENATNFRAFFTYQVDQSQFHVRGCIIGHANEKTVSALCVGDGAVAAGNHDFLDNRYFGINDANSRWSQNAAIATEANWIANVDTTGDELSSSPFANAPTDFSLSAASTLRTTDRSARTSPLPHRGFNGGRYSKHYGAWQYGPGTRGGARRGRGRARNRATDPASPLP